MTTSQFYKLSLILIYVYRDALTTNCPILLNNYREFKMGHPGLFFGHLLSLQTRQFYKKIIPLYVPNPVLPYSGMCQTG